MPRYLYDGLGNRVLAYTQAEVDNIVYFHTSKFKIESEKLDVLRAELAEKTLQLEKLVEQDKPKKRRVKDADSDTA